MPARYSRQSRPVARRAGPGCAALALALAAAGCGDKTSDRVLSGGGIGAAVGAGAAAVTGGRVLSGAALGGAAGAVAGALTDEDDIRIGD
jgi:hypothetical protein